MSPRPPSDAQSGWIPPMKAVLGDLPAGQGWAFELKWDGVRLQATTHPDGEADRAVTLRSISGRDVTDTYPEFATLGDAVTAGAVLDGEAVVFDGDRPSFGLLQHRMHVDRPTAALVEEYPAVYMVFDLLRLDGTSLLRLPYETRRRLLQELVDDGPSWRVPPESRDSGQALLDLADQRGLEGVVAKRLDSTYEPGARSRQWIKVKVRRQQEFVVGGWLPGQGALAGSIGSLLVGVHDDGRLRFSGAVGSGLTDHDRSMLLATLRERPDCPFVETPVLDRPPRWVEPQQVVEVGYGVWPADGNLRHPVYLGLRADHPPADVVRELPP
ncbi:MAG: non-homologous end-joining DNA ligase [Actinomycetota bacterium]